jgi:hypothetical protein
MQKHTRRDVVTLLGSATVFAPWSALPHFVVLEILGHVVKVVLFLGRRHFKDVFGFPDQSQSPLNLFATRVIHARPYFVGDALIHPN